MHSVQGKRQHYTLLRSLFVTCISGWFVIAVISPWFEDEYQDRIEYLSTLSQ
ncbi:MAG: hypothetical protein RM347_010500 [Nostoc sp. ChiQUE02]|uniref:hypothetical protein n=1 Tax=Nostoc sp. ChiQUE02 TaxID=3075377 RepID=UPI002AD3CA66|nr:hypothetical protein [Nostoc sp. ChiQUE02]MDZ8229237.1 hypothetical protein [Nostoc sp. ChiQUE02]